MNSGVFPLENKRDSHRTFVPVCPREKFMKWPFLVWLTGVTPEDGHRDCNLCAVSQHLPRCRDSFDHVSQWLQEARANADPERLAATAAVRGTKDQPRGSCPKGLEALEIGQK